MAPRAALVGIGGYGRALLEVLAAAQAERRCTLAAAVVRTPGRYPESERLLRELGARGYPTVPELLADRAGRLELVIEAGFAAAAPAEVPAGAVVAATPAADAAGPVTAIRGIERIVRAAHAAATGYTGTGAPWALAPRRVGLADDLSAGASAADNGEA